MTPTATKEELRLLGGNCEIWLNGVERLNSIGRDRYTYLQRALRIAMCGQRGDFG